MWVVVKISIPILIESLLGKQHIFNAIPNNFSYLKNGLCQFQILVFDCDLVT